MAFTKCPQTGKKSPVFSKFRQASFWRRSYGELDMRPLLARHEFGINLERASGNEKETSLPFHRSASGGVQAGNSSENFSPCEGRSNPAPKHIPWYAITGYAHGGLNE
jgi:hypothetical protein